jgi:imidazolonepropionase-like amidohydrolase
MAHAQGNQGIRNAVYAGVESIEHGFWLDDEVLAEMKTRGTFLVPTHMANVGFFRRAEKEPGSLLPQSIRKASQVVEASKQSVVT